MSEKRWVWTFGSIPLGGLDSLVGVLANRTQAEGLWSPNADVYLGAESIQVVLEIPGVNADLVEVRYDSSSCVLSVSGCRTPRASDCNSCQQLELYYGEFSRSIQLPQAVVEVAEIKARYDDGLLSIVLPLWKPGNFEHSIRVETI